MTRLATLITLVICAAQPLVASAEIRNVPGDYPTISEAAEDAGFWDTIVVSPGTYDEWVMLDGDDFPNIVSTNPDDPAIVASTIIQGGIQIASPSLSPIHPFRISGFTFKGGGIICELAAETDASAIISNNIFRDCFNGVEIFADFERPLRIVNNTISGSMTGILSEQISATTHGPNILGNTISDCFIGMEGRFSNVIGNTIKDNLDSGAERMVFDEFAYNHVTGNWGTGLSLSAQSWHWDFMWNEPKPIHNNTIANNEIGMFLVPLAVADSNTIVANDQAGVVIYADAPLEEPHDQILRNSIIYANGVAVEDLAGYGILSYCCSNESLPGEGNLVCDPLFVNPAAGDYHLSDASPCINRGTPEYDWQIATTDRDGDLRVIGGRIDLGADETPYTPPPLAGDMNGDGTLDGLDVQLFVEAMMNQ